MFSEQLRHKRQSKFDPCDRNPKVLMSGYPLRRWSMLVVLLTLVAVGSLVAFLVQRQTAVHLTGENESLRILTNEVQRLRRENEEVARLRAENQEIERLRNDSMALLKLRNEVHQLREEKAQWEKARAGIEQARLLSPSLAAGFPIVAGAPVGPAVGGSNSPTQQVARPWIGFYCVKVPPPADAKGANSEEKTGARVSLVQPGSPAEKAGLQVDDIVVAVNDLPIRKPEDLSDPLQKLVIGQGLTVDVVRESAPLRFQMQVGERPPDL